MKAFQDAVKALFVSVIGVCFIFSLTDRILAQDATTEGGTVIEDKGFFQGWNGKLFAGFSKSSGNTKKASAAANAEALKKWDHSSYLLKGSLLYTETDENMDGQKWDILNRYALDFGAAYRWYNFYQVYVDHDYFADIDYRITPSAGMGYHILTDPGWIWDADLGIGYRITRHRANTREDDEDPTALVHTFMKKRVFEKSYISEDLTVYPGLSSGAGVLVKSESVFTNPISDVLALEIKYIVDYNSEPAADKKKADKQILAGVTYTF